MKIELCINVSNQDGLLFETFQRVLLPPPHGGRGSTKLKNYSKCNIEE